MCVSDSEDSTERYSCEFCKAVLFRNAIYSKEKLCLQESIEDIPVLEEWLTKKRGHKVTYPHSTERNERETGRTCCEKCGIGS